MSRGLVYLIKSILLAIGLFLLVVFVMNAKSKDFSSYAWVLILVVIFIPTGWSFSLKNGWSYLSIGSVIVFGIICWILVAFLKELIVTHKDIVVGIILALTGLFRLKDSAKFSSYCSKGVNIISFIYPLIFILFGILTIFSKSSGTIRFIILPGIVLYLISAIEHAKKAEEVWIDE